MAKAVPEEYNFVPRTWILPSDHNIIQNYMKDLKAHKKSKTFIVKPSNGAQGHGLVYRHYAQSLFQIFYGILQISISEICCF